MSKKVYGYVIIDSETGEQWGDTYASKAGAAASYNSHFNSPWRNVDRHKFADQMVYVRKELVLAE
jgi:hypothetical protein